MELLTFHLLLPDYTSLLDFFKNPTHSTCTSNWASQQKDQSFGRTSGLTNDETQRREKEREKMEVAKRRPTKPKDLPKAEKKHGPTRRTQAQTLKI